jgi:hypothetical protein
MREDADVIYYWERCKTMGEALGLSIGIVGETLHAKGQCGEKTIFYTCETAQELRGYLEGLTAMKGEVTQ